MSDVILSPNMSMPVPIVGVDPGPDWANNINASLGILDQHDHSAGRGVPVTPNGLNINADLAINGNNLTTVKTVNFTAQGAPLSGVAPNLGAVYVAGNELYYNDEVGNVVQITNLGSVNAGAGSITGLPSGTASASYSSGNQTFVWQSATSTAANMDGGSVIIREVVANAKGVTLSSPGSLAADYTLTFPAGLPGSIKFLTVDNAGNVGNTIYVDNTTIEVAANNIQIKDDGVTTPKILDGSVTKPKLAALGQQASASSATALTSNTSYTTLNNMTVTITTTGRPVMLMIQSDGSGNPAYMDCRAAPTVFFRFFRDSSADVGTYRFFIDSLTGAANSNLPLSIFTTMDMTASAGTHTYEFQAVVLPGQTAGIQFAKLVAYEL